MNKKNLILAIIFLTVVGLAWWYTNTDSSEVLQTPDTNTPSVAATIFPVYDITRHVAGDLLEVKLILPPGASPHTFDATPSTLKNLQDVHHIFAIGQGIDSWSFGIADNIPNATIIELDTYITLKESTGHEDEHKDEGDKADDHEDSAFDPHYWLDPDNAIIMANAIADELGTLDPINAKQYKQNADAFANTVQKKDEAWKIILSTLPEKNIVTFHNGFFYFADHFSLRVLTTFEPFPGKEPTPSYLQELEHEIEEYGIRDVFTEPQLHGASLVQFAKDHDIDVFVLDPIGGVEGRTSYSDLIDYNVETIAHALK